MIILLYVCYLNAYKEDNITIFLLNYLLFNFFFIHLCFITQF